MKHHQYWLAGLAFATLGHAAQAQVFSITETTIKNPWRITGESGYEDGWTLSNVDTGESRKFENPAQGYWPQRLSLGVDMNGSVLVAWQPDSASRAYLVIDRNGRTTSVGSSSYDGYASFNTSGEGELQVCETYTWYRTTCTLQTQHGAFTMPGPGRSSSGDPNATWVTPNPALGANSLGTLVGSYYGDVAKVSRGGKLDVLPVKGAGLDISDTGVIVGRMTVNDAHKAMMVDGEGHILDLNSLLDPSSPLAGQVSLYAATYISPDGSSIRAWGNYLGVDGHAPSGKSVAFTLTMVPEPSACLMMAVGLLGLAGLVRRKAAA